MSLIAWCTAADSGTVSEDKGRQRELAELLTRYGPKPLIHHTFKEPEKRPPTIVSDAFTILVMLPLPLLFVLWSAIGVNLSGFRASLSGILFHTGIILIVALMFCAFWYNMNMFLILKCLSGVLVMTFVSGHFLLKDFAKKRQLGLVS